MWKVLTLASGSLVGEAAPVATDAMPRMGIEDLKAAGRPAAANRREVVRREAIVVCGGVEWES